MKNKELAEIFYVAAEYIQENGWTQGRYEDKNGCLCALGAINKAMHGYPTDMDGYAENVDLPTANRLHHELDLFLHAFCEWKGSYGSDALAGWNDEKDRDIDQVIRRLNEYGDMLGGSDEDTAIDH